MFYLTKNRLTFAGLLLAALALMPASGCGHSANAANQQSPSSISDDESPAQRKWRLEREKRATRRTAPFSRTPRRV